MEMDEFVLLVEDLRRLGHDLAQSEMAKLRAELDEVRRDPNPNPSPSPSPSPNPTPHQVRRKLDTAQRNMGEVFATLTPTRTP